MTSNGRYADVLGPILKRPTSVPSDCFEFSLAAASPRNPHDHDSGATCQHPFVEGWDLGCSSCRVDLGASRRAEEEAHAAAAKQQDESAAAGFSHANRLRTWAVSVAWLVAFTFDHECWAWPTWRVVRDIIKPSTAATRCRWGHPEAAAALQARVALGGPM